MSIGYACNNISLGKSGKFRVMTVKSALKMSEQDRHDELKKRTRENFSNLYDITKWNVENNIHLYRVSSGMCILFTHEVCNYNFTEDQVVIDLCSKIVSMCKDNDIRMTIHPDAYNVLGSVNQCVIDNTIVALEYHYKLMALLNIDTMCLHVGCKTDGIEATKQRFIDTFNKLSDNLKGIICLENDDKSFNVSDTLEICEAIGIPMILDIHHNRCLPSEYMCSHYIDRIVDTWDHRKPKCHISTGKLNITDRSHADYVSANDLISVYEICGDRFDIMLECKKKELSLLQLRKDDAYC